MSIESGDLNENIRDAFESGEEKSQRQEERRAQRRAESVDLSKLEDVKAHLKKEGNTPISFIEEYWNEWDKLREMDPTDRDEYIENNFSGEAYAKISTINATLSRLEEFNQQET